MMDYYVFWMIMAILFWVLFALAVVSGIAWVYTQVMYYRWTKEDREQANLIEQVQQTVKDKIEEIGQNNS